MSSINGESKSGRVEAAEVRYSHGRCYLIQYLNVAFSTGDRMTGVHADSLLSELCLAPSEMCLQVGQVLANARLADVSGVCISPGALGGTTRKGCSAGGAADHTRDLLVLATEGEPTMSPDSESP